MPLHVEHKPLRSLLPELMERRGMNYRELADAIASRYPGEQTPTQDYLSKVGRGIRTPPSATTARILATLSTPPQAATEWWAAIVREQLHHQTGTPADLVQNVNDLLRAYNALGSTESGGDSASGPLAKLLASRLQSQG